MDPDGLDQFTQMCGRANRDSFKGEKRGTVITDNLTSINYRDILRARENDTQPKKKQEKKVKKEKQEK